MVFGPCRSNNFDLRIEDSIIERVSEAKFLGIILDDDLNFKAHVNGVLLKVNSACGIIRQFRPSLPQSVLKTIYFSLVWSHLSYGIVVWGKCSVTEVNRVESSE